MRTVMKKAFDAFAFRDVAYGISWHLIASHTTSWHLIAIRSKVALKFSAQLFVAARGIIWTGQLQLTFGHCKAHGTFPGRTSLQRSCSGIRDARDGWRGLEQDKHYARHSAWATSQIRTDSHDISLCKLKRTTSHNLMQNEP